MPISSDVIDYMIRQRHKPNRPGVADVARLAGVSTATVSRALNRSALVNPKISQRVLAAAGKLNYRLNTAARDLARNRSSLILLAVGDPAGMTLSQSVLLRALASRVLQRGEFPVLIADDPARESSLPGGLDIFAAAGGALCLGESALLRELHRHSIPTVLVDAEPGARQSKLCLDRRAGFQKAAAHLLERSHRRIGFVGSSGDPKFDAFSEAICAAGAECIAVESDQLAAFVAREASAERVTAWMLPGETLVITAVSILASAGRRIGLDTAVISQGDTYLAQRCSPPLTALRHPNELMASVAMDLLQALHANPNSTHSATLELELIVRPSTDFTVRA
jgi:LacI family transcriptional regulator